MTLYHGGKYRHGKEIADVIKRIYDNHEDRIQGYIEPFCGMCGVFRHIPNLLPNRLKFKASDQHKSLILMWKALQNGWIPPKDCNISWYEKLKYSKPSPEKGFVGFGCSFGGVYFGGFLKTYGKPYPNIHNTLEIAKTVSIVKFNQNTYLYYTPKNTKGYIIYCDPPYTNIKHSRYFIDDDSTMQISHFDSTEFWAWCRTMSKYNIVLISEYSAPKDFQIVHTFDSKRYGNTQNEHIFMYKNYFN